MKRSAEYQPLWDWDQRPAWTEARRVFRATFPGAASPLIRQRLPSTHFPTGPGPARAPIGPFLILILVYAIHLWPHGIL
jgi:hypothetical protein